MSETWWKYVERITGCAHQDRIAQHTEIEPSSVWQWKSRHNRPKAEHVITFARVYHRPPVEALIAAGYLDPTDVSVDPTEFNELDEIAARPLREVSTDDLIAELRRRLRS